jgi:5'-nucleotidase/UDP-sugar diphosphatase
LTHEGFEDDSVLAANVKGLDVIIGGHSHTRLKRPRLINGVLIVQTGSNCENLGVLDLTVDGGHVVSYDGRLLPLWSRGDRPVTALTRFIDSVQRGIDKVYSEVLASLKFDWLRTQGESSIGNFITDAQRKAAGAEIAFMNTHGIRKDVPAGPLTKLDLFEVLPFHNVLTTFQLHGRQLRTAMQFHLMQGTGVLTSGISCRWKRTADGDVEILSMQVQEKPVEDEETYRCAASDFFIGEAKRYLGIEIPQVLYLKETVFEAVEKEIRRVGVISPTLERHVVELK